MARNQVCLFVSLHLTVILLSNYYVLSTASDVREAAPHEDVCGVYSPEDTNNG